MKPAGQKGKLLLYSKQAVRFAFLYLIIGIITTGYSDSMATTEDQRIRRMFKDGHVIIGGLASLYTYRCGMFIPSNLGIVEAIIYAIEGINKDKTLLPNLTLGYDIRDTCEHAIMTARHAYQFATASTMNCKAVMCLSNHKCICDANGTSFDNKFTSKNYSSTYPVIAIVGELPSRVAIPLANFLQAVRIPYVESSATSEELSSSIYESFFRTIPSDANQAKVFADIIERFGWRYVAVVAVDDSYGRHGVLALERESIKRRTFCVEVFGYIPLLNYKNKLKMMMSSLSLRKTVTVTIVWSGSTYARDMLKFAVKESVRNRVWIFGESIAGKTPEYLSSIQNLSSTGIHIGVKFQSKDPEHFRGHLQNRLVRNHSSEENFGWTEFWEYLALTNRSHKSSSELLNMTYDDYAIFMIDAVYSIADALDRMLRCKRARVSASINKDLCPENKETIETGQLVEYLKKVEFQGVTGKVQFDSKGDPVEAIYDIVYFNITKRNDSEIVTKDVIGQWNKNRTDRLEISNASIRWETHSNEGKTPSSTCTDECKPRQFKTPTTECCWKCLPCLDGSVSETNGVLSCKKCTEKQMSNFKRTHCIPLPITNIDWSDISFSLYIFLLSWITYYPVDYATEGWYVAVLSGATLLLTSYGLLGCIFGPKLFIIVLHHEKNTMEFIRNEMRDNNVRQSGNNSSSVRPVDAST